MKLSVNQDLLSKTLRRCVLASGGSLNPVHANVKLEASKGKGGGPDLLAFSSLSGQMAINTSVQARVTEPGIIAANTKYLSNASGAMPSGDMTLHTTDKRVVLTGSSGRKMSGDLADPDTIKPVPDPEKAAWLRVPVAALRKAISAVAHTSSDVDDSNDHKSRDGVRIEANDGKLTAIGCSDHMCVVYEQKVELGQKDSWQALIPTQAMGSINDVLEEAEEAKASTIELYSDDYFLWAVGPSTLFVASLPVGDFPPWRLLLQGFPKDDICKPPRLALIESIKACQATGTKQDVGAKFRITAGNITLFRADEASEFLETIPLVDMQPNTNITFKSSLPYMLSCLRAADEDVSFTFGPDGKMLLAHTTTGYRAAMALMDDPDLQPKAAAAKK